METKKGLEFKISEIEEIKEEDENILESEVEEKLKINVNQANLPEMSNSKQKREIIEDHGQLNTEQIEQNLFAFEK